MNHKVFRHLSYGVYVVSTTDGPRFTGCIANSAMQITSSPATVAISINHDNYTNSCIQKSGVFALSILTEQSDASIIGTFGFQSGKEINKFDSVRHSVRNGIAVVDDACGYLICKVTDKMETSTHTVFLGEVIDGELLESAPAMTYAYYHNVIKGKSPKNAPTYLPEEEAPAEAKPSGQWVCSVCGHVYDGEIPFEELPDDFVCPVCRQPKEKFHQK